jgi:hypothetical protein
VTTALMTLIQVSDSSGSFGVGRIRYGDVTRT